jgi:pyridoxal phosphate enzyme (YggS family)
MGSIGMRLQHVQGRIASAVSAHGRAPGSVRLLAVAKTFGPEAVHAAHAAGQRAFGENYVQEAVAKIEALAALRAGPEGLEDLGGPDGVEWHLIGPLQSNKTRTVAEHFDWVQTIDRAKTAERLAAQRPAHLAPLRLCVQVNTSGEASKAGAAPGEVMALVREIAALPPERVRLCGLMAIPEPAGSFDAQRAMHRRLRDLLARVLGETGLPLDTLSMGMSGDLEAAVAEGATIVRVGSAIFGERSRPAP